MTSRQQQQPAVAAAEQQQQQQAPEVQPEWNGEECDRYSFDDSDRFEEDSLCSWSSEPESLCNNWRGWKRPIANGNFGNGALRKQIDGKSDLQTIYPSFYTFK